MYDEQAAKKIAIISFPGEYGQDGAAGAKLAAKELGMEIVYDGEAKVTPPSPTNPNPDNSAVVTAIAGSGADVVFATINPATLATLMGQSSAKGFKGKWTGSSPTYNEALLKSDVKSVIDSSYFQSTYTVALGTNVPGMKDMVDTIKASKPAARASDAYVYGWTEAQITDAILRKAAESKDMTRAGVVKAAFELDKVDFGGLAPAQSWKGDPNDFVVRESYIFKPKTSLFKEGAVGVGNTGSELLKGPFASDITKNYKYAGACYKPKA
jgi:ABC-type branched-subunit amino acid transport system substrate-binding protein